MEYEELDVELAPGELTVAASQIPVAERAVTESAASKTRPGEIIIGVLEGIDEQGNALVDFAENLTDKPLTAISTVAVNHQQSGQQVALLFAEGDIAKPVIMGLIHNPLSQMIESFEMHSEESSRENSIDVSAQKNKIKTEAPVETSAIDNVHIDGKRVVLEGQEEVILKCGEASITLTKAGKILIRGKYLLNRSTGVNRIMGGSVQVN